MMTLRNDSDDDNSLMMIAVCNDSDDDDSFQ